MKKKLFVVFFSFLALNCLGQANKVDVQKLVELSGELQYYYNVADQISRQLSESNQEAFKKDLQPLIERQKNKLITYYSQNLSQGEVDNLIEFYQSPLAKKYKMIRENYAVVLGNKSNEFKEEIQGIIMKYMM